MKAEEKQALIDAAITKINYFKNVRTRRGRLFQQEEHELALINTALTALTEQPVDWQQRAEEAEARASNLNDGWLNAITERDEARAKLAELKKQKPSGFRWRWARDENAVWTYCHMDKFEEAVAAFGDNATFEKVYSQPAPAVSLAELVPGALTWSYHDNVTQGEVQGWNSCRAAILRNIEEATKK